MNSRRGLYRSRTDSIIGGVSGGIANYLNTDPTYFRIIFAMLAIFGGGGVFIYIILWIAIPIEPIYYYKPDQAYTKNTNMEDSQRNYQQDETGREPGHYPQKPDKKSGSLIAGLILIALGIIFLVDRFVPRVDFLDLWPLILLVIGIILVREGYQRKSSKDEVQ